MASSKCLHHKLSVYTVDGQVVVLNPVKLEKFDAEVHGEAAKEFRHDHSKEEDDKPAFAVIDGQNQLRGIIVYTVDKTSEPYTAFIHWISTRSGFGSGALRVFERTMKEQGVEFINLNCSANNSELDEVVTHRFNFYQRNGYTIEKVKYHTEIEEDGFQLIQALFAMFKKLESSDVD